MRPSPLILGRSPSLAAPSNRDQTPSPTYHTAPQSPIGSPVIAAFGQIELGRAPAGGLRRACSLLQSKAAAVVGSRGPMGRAGHKSRSRSCAPNVTDARPRGAIGSQQQVLAQPAPPAPAPAATSAAPVTHDRAPSLARGGPAAQQGTQRPPPPRRAPLFFEARTGTLSLVRNARGALVIDAATAHRLVAAYGGTQAHEQLLTGLLSPDTALVHVRAEAAEVLFQAFTGRENPRLVRTFLNALQLDPLTRWALQNPLRPDTAADASPPRGGGVRGGRPAAPAPTPVPTFAPVRATLPTEVVCCGQRPGGGWVSLHVADMAAWARDALLRPPHPHERGLGYVAMGFVAAASPDAARVADQPAGGRRATASIGRAAGKLLMPLLGPPISVRGGLAEVFRTAVADVYVAWPQVEAGAAPAQRAGSGLTGWYKRRGCQAEPLNFAHRIATDG